MYSNVEEGLWQAVITVGCASPVRIKVHGLEEDMTAQHEAFATERQRIDLAMYWLKRYAEGAIIEVRTSTHEDFERVASVGRLGQFLVNFGCKISQEPMLYIRVRPENSGKIRPFSIDEVPIGRVIAKMSGDGGSINKDYSEVGRYARRLIIATELDRGVVLGGAGLAVTLQYFMEHYVLMGVTLQTRNKFDGPCGVWQSGPFPHQYDYWMVTSRMTPRMKEFAYNIGMRTQVVDGVERYIRA